MSKVSHYRRTRRWQRRSQPPATIAELCDRYQSWADAEYQKLTRDGSRRPTREADCQRDAMRALRHASTDPETTAAVDAGELPESERPPQIAELEPSQMCAELLYAAREWMVQQRLARSEINKRLQRLRRVFKWAAQPPRRWIASEINADLQLVEPLRIGRTDAPERQPVTSAPDKLVQAVQVHLAEQSQSADPATCARAHELATMIDLHAHCGARTSELAGMRRSELHEAEGWLVYQPGEHKTQHHGKVRQVFLGPIARRLIEDWTRRLDADPSTAGRDNLWRWTRGETYAAQIERACDAVHPPPAHLAQQQRPANGRKKVLRWETRTEWQQRLGPERWQELLEWRKARRFTPGQLRHTFATRLEREAGKAGERAAQKLLGHSTLKTTQIYIDPDMHDALEVLKSVG